LRKKDVAIVQGPTGAGVMGIALRAPPLLRMLLNRNIPNGRSRI
jgi:hypothetical protein